MEDLRSRSIALRVGKEYIGAICQIKVPVQDRHQTLREWHQVGESGRNAVELVPNLDTERGDVVQSVLSHDLVLLGEGYDRSDVVLSCIPGAFQHRLQTQFMICSDLRKRRGGLRIQIE